VWLNPNFADNAPLKHAYGSDRIAKDFAARKMIDEIFHVVEEHTAGRGFPSYFKAGWNPNNFAEAINAVKDYATETGTAIAKRVTLPHHARTSETAATTTTTTTTTVTETRVPA